MIENKKKAKILNTAIKLFAAKGYSATGMREIARKAGLTTGGLYNYYKSKRQILYDIQKECVSNLLDEISYCPEEMTAREKLEFIVVALLKVIHYYKFPYQIMFSEYLHFNKAERDLLKEDTKKIEDFMVQTLQEGIRKGDFKKHPNNMNFKEYVSLIALFLFGVCQHATRWYDPEGTVPYDKIGKLFATLALDGLYATQPQQQQTKDS